MLIQFHYCRLVLSVYLTLISLCLRTSAWNAHGTPRIGEPLVREHVLRDIRGEGLSIGAILNGDGLIEKTVNQDYLNTKLLPHDSIINGSPVNKPVTRALHANQPKALVVSDGAVEAPSEGQTLVPGLEEDLDDWTGGENTTQYGVNCRQICDMVEGSHGAEELQCSRSCRRHQCRSGCQRWASAASSSSCQQACKKRYSWHEDDAQGLYCTMGCVYAAQQYMRAARDLIGTPSEPLLIAGSLTNSSLGLRWDSLGFFPAIDNSHGKSHSGLNTSTYETLLHDSTEYHSGSSKESGLITVLPIRFLVQYRSLTQDWEYHKESGIIEEDVTTVKGLRPYTKYQFRIAWLLLPGHPPLLSHPSSWISTLPYGPPQTPPTDLSATPLDSSRVQVVWGAPVYPAGEVVSYTLYAKDATTGDEFRKDIPLMHPKIFELSGLRANTSYNLRVAAVNRLGGEGPPAHLTVTTYPTSEESGEGGYVLLAAGSSLLRLELDILKPPVYLYNTSTLQDITGLALHIRLGLLYVSESTGGILQLRPATKQRRILDLKDKLNGGVPTTLSVDWLNGFLYFVEDPYKGGFADNESKEKEEFNFRTRRGFAENNKFLFKKYFWETTENAIRRRREFVEASHIKKRNRRGSMYPGEIKKDSDFRRRINREDRSNSHRDHKKNSNNGKLRGEQVNSSHETSGLTHNLSRFITDFGDEDHIEKQAQPKWYIWRTDLMGEHLELVVDLSYEPKHMQVDPYNGYLWWVHSGNEGGGLYRLDVGLDPPGHLPIRIVEDSGLGGFVPDPLNFRVLATNRNNNTMMSVSLDGSVIGDARSNTQQAFFSEAEEVVLLHRRFYWTSPREVFTEELNGGTFYHNSYAMVNSRTGPLVAVHPSVQPLPAPLGPPRRLQVLFTAASAATRWAAPLPPPLMGSGAWRAWSYELHIQEGQKIIFLRNITKTEFDAANLRPDTFYKMKVRAYSSGGHGPWSETFSGRTLVYFDVKPRLILATNQGLLSADMAGANISLVASVHFIKENLGSNHITDMTFFRDLLIIAAVNSSVMVLNTTTINRINTNINLSSGNNTNNKLNFNLNTNDGVSSGGDMNISSRGVRFLEGTRGVLSVAVDWLTKRIFWANPHLHVIGWSSLSSLNHGALGLLTGALELEVDSLRGRLFWATRHAVYSATLLGRHRTALYKEDLFSGRQVFGLALDAVRGRLWWGVHSPEGHQLYATDTTAPQPRVLRELPLMHSLDTGPFAYVSNRLVFLDGSGRLLLSDTDLNSTATLAATSLQVRRCVVLLEDLQPTPGHHVQVLPAPVNATSMGTHGTWNQFTVAWEALTNVNHGSVLYEMVVEVLLEEEDMRHDKNRARSSEQRFMVSSEENEVTLPWRPSRPFQLLRISIRGITSWGAGPKTVALLRTPPSLPGPPQNLRYFVEIQKEPLMSLVHLRWLPPRDRNGVIEDYEIEICRDDGSTGCLRHILNGTTLEYVVQQMQEEHSITFKVSAATSVGYGPYSAAIAITSFRHRPAPRLAVASSRLLQLMDADLDNRVLLRRLDSKGPPTAGTFIKHGRTHDMVGTTTSKEAHYRYNAGNVGDAASVETSTNTNTANDLKTFPRTSIGAEREGHGFGLGALLKNESVIFIEDGYDVVMVNIVKNTSKKIFRLQKEGFALTVDWVAEKALWLEETHLPAHTHHYLSYNDHVHHYPGYTNISPHQYQYQQQYHSQYQNQRQLPQQQQHAKTRLHLKALDLNFGTFETLSSLQLEGTVVNMVVSPLKNVVYVMEEVRSSHRLLAAHFSSTPATFKDFFQGGSRNAVLFTPTKTTSHSTTSTRPCSCPTSPILAGGFTCDGATSRVLFSTTHEDKFGAAIVTADHRGCDCNIVVTMGVFGQGGCSSLAVDTSHIFCYMSITEELLWFPKHTEVMGETKAASTSHHSGSRHLDTLHPSSPSPFLRVLPLQGPHVALCSLDPTTQPMPDLECLTPKTPASLWVESVGADSVALQITPPSPSAEDGCSSVAQPGLRYTLYYRLANASGDTTCDEAGEDCFVKSTTERTVTLAGLASFTPYRVRVAAYTAYGLRQRRPAVHSAEIPFTTRARAPSAARNLNVTAITPESIEVSFQAMRLLPYKIFWKTNTSIEGIMRVPGERHEVVKDLKEGGVVVTSRVDNLDPDTKHQVWVRLLSPLDAAVYTDGPRTAVLTLPRLPAVTLLGATPHSITVAWAAPSDGAIHRHAIEHLVPSSDPGVEPVWFGRQFEVTTAGKRYEYEVTDLQPGQHYIFRVKVLYNTEGFHQYTWPHSPLFNFSTLNDIPGAPGKVRLQQVVDEWEVWWGEADPRGSPIVSYVLQAVPLHSLRGDGADGDQRTEEVVYITVYNGSVNHWGVAAMRGVFNTVGAAMRATTESTGAEASSKATGVDAGPEAKGKMGVGSVFVFRVRAVNDVGAGPWSDPSSLDTAGGGPTTTTLVSEASLPTILAATIPASLLFFLVLFSLLVCAMRRADGCSSKMKAATLSSSVQHTSSRELELSSMHQLQPNNNNFVSEDNILYNMQSFPGDEIDLPRVSQHCIVRTKFLGSGAFGEVFEGTASGIAGLPGGCRVAVKMLRKGSTESEKCEFLKEAQLMSHFQHDHILRLLAICADYDPFFLVLELMEGGDLLSYLRANRGGNGSNVFDLGDLTSMCVDVAKGCRYLEEMHFVHRDLAARNCLVSSTDRATRIVKIGDFGLARDIYKNDYYRKEGEGMLPVRWMSPESLLDGVFTSHSDAWAFGVLLWEINTLGQQPYPARTNLEVMQYVRTGGTLTPPQDCPIEVEELMRRCWIFNPEERPTFTGCLTVLEALQEALTPRPQPPTLPPPPPPPPRTLAVHNANYLGSQGAGGLDNLAYDTSDKDTYWSSDQSGSSTLVADFKDARFNCGYSSTADQRTPNKSLDLHEDCESAASTVPLNAPLRNGQLYFQLVNEPSFSLKSQSSFPSLPNELQQSPLSEVSTDLSIVSTTSTYCPDMSFPSTSTQTNTLNRRASSPPAVTKFMFNCPNASTSSAHMSSYVSPIHSPSPFLLALVNGFPESSFSRANSFRLQPRLTSPTVPDSPTSVSFTFPMLTRSEHYVSPSNNKSCAPNDVIITSPPATPDDKVVDVPPLNENNIEKKIPQSVVLQHSYVNNNIINEDYTPPESNKSSPENANSLTHDGLLRPRRSASFESITKSDTQSNCYINMSPYKENMRHTLNQYKGGFEQHKLNLSHLGRSEGSINRMDYLLASPEEFSCRLSGVSDLSGLSGMTAASTIDLDFVPAQSTC